MGSYAHLYVGALKFDWAKNGTSRWVVHLFRSGDRRVAQARSVPVPRAVMRDYEGERFEPTADFPAVYYQTSVGVLRERLDLIGYTLSTARHYFEVAKDVEAMADMPRGTRLAASPDEWMAWVRRANALACVEDRPVLQSTNCVTPASLPLLNVDDPADSFPGYDVYAAVSYTHLTLPTTPYV